MGSVQTQFSQNQDHSREGKSCGLDVEPEVAFCEGHKLKDNMKKTLIVLTTLLAAGLSTTIFGSVVVLGPGAASSGPISNGSAPINTTTSQHMIGSGAWQANGIPQAASQYYLYANPNLGGNSSTEQGLGQLTISSLSSLSFSTFNTTGGSTPNWYLIVYTAPYAGGEASWYGNRLVLEPYLANGLANPANQWVTWSTAAGANQLTICDTGGGPPPTSGNLGFYGQPTLANIQSGPITWSTLSSGGSSTPINYANMNIEGIVLSTGSGWAAGFTGMVDDVNINSTPGNVQFDLESVPEPTTMIAGALLLLPFGASTIRILRKNRTA
jgi:hypothetical protein